MLKVTLVSPACSVKVAEHDALGLDDLAPPRIRQQARRPETQTTATFTQWTGGSESNRQSHFSPPSRPIHSCPVVVPK